MFTCVFVRVSGAGVIDVGLQAFDFGAYNSMNSTEAVRGSSLLELEPFLDCVLKVAPSCQVKFSVVALIYSTILRAMYVYRRRQF
jgi:hypothetical protein